jgi:eukaryotic-like serine/threonine-protein kinase
VTLTPEAAQGTEQVGPGQQPAFAPPRAPTDPPSDLAGYRLGRRLGAGGMGAVYAAVDPADGSPVALKVLRPDLAAVGPEFAARFRREAEAMAEVRHPHLVRLHGSGEDRGWLWLAMEYLPDGDLATYVKRRGQLMEKDAIRIALQCAQALASLHAHGLVHRDFKPENVFLDQSRQRGEPVAKVGDLGLARHVSGEDRMTMTGTACGTPSCMAPEQIRGAGDLDHRVDVYALGACLYKLITGEDAFTGATIFMLTDAVLKVPAPDPRRRNPTITPGLAGVIAKAMAKSRDDRFRTMDDLIADLERLIAGRLIASAAPSPASMIFNEVAGAPAPVPLRPADPGGGGGGGGFDLSSWGPMLRLGIPAVLVCTSLSVLVWTMGGDTEPAPEAAVVPDTAPIRLAGDRILEVDVAGRTCTFRWVPPGTCTRGQDGGPSWQRPQTITLTRGVWMLDREVSRSLHAALTGLVPPIGADAALAVGDVTHDQALACCDRINALVPGLAARLPTEAEYERAALADGASTTPGQAARDPAVLAAWPAVPEDGRLPAAVEDVWRLAHDQSTFLPAPAGAGTPNAWGIADLLGNQQEWCADLWDGVTPYADTPETDPRSDSGDLAVVRGGSWMHTADRCTAAWRGAQRPDQATPWTGFRVVIPGGLDPVLPATSSAP